MRGRDPSTRLARRGTVRRVLPLAVASLTLSCAPGFTSGSKLRSLRVLAVQKDKPYAKPGDTVKLDMLYDDGPKDPNVPSAPRPIQITWYPGCENPAGDLYADCFTGNALAGFVKSLANPLSGPEITFPISKNILDRPPPANKKQPPYGLAYVFFVACAGTVKPNPNPGQNEFPLECVSSTGEVLGPDDFVVGYVSVYAYPDFQNKNPKLQAPYFTVDGANAPAECTDAACIPFERGGSTSGGLPRIDAGSSGADGSALDAGFVHDAGTAFVDGGHDAGFGIIDGGDGDGGRANDGGKSASHLDAGTTAEVPAASIPACTAASENDCPDHGITLVTDPSSVEEDAVQEKVSGGTVYEQAWIDYYVDNGSVTNEVKLLGDATKGYIADHATNLHAPQISSANAADFPPKVGLNFHVWAVAHDSRGGVSWARVVINSYAPK